MNDNDEITPWWSTRTMWFIAAAVGALLWCGIFALAGVV